MKYPVVDNAVTVKARVAWKDGNGKPITQLTQQFSIKIQGNNEDTTCTDKTVDSNEKTTNKNLAFTKDFAATGEWEHKKVEISQVMKIDPESDAI